MSVAWHGFCTVGIHEPQIPHSLPIFRATRQFLPRPVPGLPPVGTAMSPASALSEAARLHDAGDFVAARGAYREIIARDPGQARAMYLLGLLERACGDRDASMASLRRSLGWEALW